jgi:MFS family permease
VPICAGLLLFSRTPVHGDYVVYVLPATILIGLGAGAGFPALMTLAMSGATPSDSGLASGLVNASTQIGGAIGLAVLATVATGRTHALLGQGHPAATALNSGYHLAYLLGALLIAAAAAIAFAVLRPAQAPGAAHTAHAAHGAGRSAADRSAAEAACSEVA